MYYLHTNVMLMALVIKADIFFIVSRTIKKNFKNILENLK